MAAFNFRPEYLTGFFVFAFGCCIGSFLNVCIWRIPRGKSLSKPRGSICPNCRRDIRGYDNIPLLSYILLLGRCRFCRSSISPRYPFVEALTGAIFLALYLIQVVNGVMDTGELIVMALLVSLLIAASGIDMEFCIIPDEITFYGMIGGLLAGLMLPHMHTGGYSWHTFAQSSHGAGLLASLIGLLAGCGIVLVFSIPGSIILRREAIGFGDVKLMAMIGAFTGWRIALISFFIAPFLGLIYGIPMLLKRRKHSMPFGPFLSGAAIAALLFRGELTMLFNVYLDTLGAVFRTLF